MVLSGSGLGVGGARLIDLMVSLFIPRVIRSADASRGRVTRMVEIRIERLESWSKAMALSETVKTGQKVPIQWEHESILQHMPKKTAEPSAGFAHQIVRFHLLLENVESIHRCFALFSFVFAATKCGIRLELIVHQFFLKFPFIA